MANEFKIKKGLIVTGASGGTVVDIQGSQGQLFSVTDDLSGSIFAVSDISGVPILDVNSSGLSTFSDNVVIGSVDSVVTGLNIGEASPTIQLFDTTNDGKLLMYMQDSSAVIGTYSNHSLNLFTDSTLALAIDTSQNAAFAAKVQAASWFQGNGATNTLYSNVTAGVLLQTAGSTEDNNDSKIFFRNSATTVKHTFDTYNGDATFVGQGFSSATSSGDASSTLTTKGYVDSLITGATIYRGAWDPSGGGYGSPDLSGVTQTSGYYYICSAAGTAEPNGTGCEPDSWETGDWVIWNDDIVDCAGTGTGGWQKIDNSSVLSGVGTGQTVALWEGAGSVTDSDTLGNAPITVDGNNVNFADSISVADSARFEGTTSPITIGDGFGYGGSATICKHNGPLYLQYNNGQANTDLVLGGNGTAVRLQDATSNYTFTADGSSDSFVVGQGGDFGVGITNPNATLHVKNNAAGITARIQQGADGEESAIRFQTLDGNNSRYTDIAQNAVTGNLDIRAPYNATIPNLTIKNGGDIGINISDPQAQLHISAGAPAPNTNAVTSLGVGLVVSGNDGLMDLLSYDDNTTVATSIGMGRYNQTTGNIIDKWGLVTWYDTGNEGSNLSERITLHYGTNKLPWNSTGMVTVLRDGNVGIGTNTPFTNASDNNGLNIDRGGHSSLLIGDGVNDGGMIQSSDNSQRIIITANAYDSPTASWSRFTEDSAALIDVYGEGTQAFISLNVDNGTAGFPAARLTVSNTGGIRFNTYGGTAKTGTPTYLLGTDVSGNIVKTLPYVPPAGTTQFFNQSNLYNNSTPGITGFGNVSMDTSVSYYDTGKNVSTYTRGMVWTGKHYIVTTYNAPLAANFYSNNFDSITNPEASSITLPPPSSGGSNPHGAAWDGRYLYCINYTPMKILAYDLDNGTTTATVVSETDISSYSTVTYDIEYAEGHLYTCADGKVSKFKVEGKTITHVFTSGVILATIDAQAITYDGSYLWFTQNGANAYKVSLDCVLVATITTGLPPNNIGWAWNGQNVATVNYSTGDVYVLNTAETRFDTEEFIVMGGNVGIGTTSPGTKLTISGGDDAAAIGVLELITSGGTNLKFGGNTGYSWIQSHASKPLYINQLGNNVILNSNGGNVGIGTTNPSKKLEVNGNFKLGTNAYIEYGGVYPYTITTANTAAVGNLVFSAGLGSAAYESKIDLQGTNTAGVAGITLSTASTARMVVTADGDVGIGTSTPNAKLDIQGTQGQLFSVTDDLSGSIFAVSDISGVPIFDVNSSGISYFDGNVGIGTESPDSRLDVTGGNITINTLGTTFADFKYGAVGSETSRGSITTDGIDLKVNATADLLLLPTGNVGIGTTSPAYKLQVGDNGVADGNIAMKANGTGADAGAELTFNMNVGGGNANSYIAQIVPISYDSLSSGTHNSLNFKVGTWNNNADAGVSRMTILSNGKVGIGTTDPVNNLTVNGDIGYVGFIGQGNIYGNTGNSSYANMQLYNPSTGYSTFNNQTYGYYLQTGGSTKLTILNNGNVGINTTTPLVKLQVDGGIRAIGTTSTTGQIDASPDFGAFRFYNGNTFRGGLGTGQWASVGNNADIVQYLNSVNYYISNGSTALLKVDTSGKVGIGTTSPSAKLHVHTDDDNAYAVRIEGSTNNVAGVWTGLGIGGEANNTKSAILFEDVGLSYSRGKLHLCVNNEANQNSATTADAKLTVSNDGNVGINTTTPAYLLDVRDGTSSGAIARFTSINAHVIIESSTAGPAVLHLKPNITGNKSGQFKVTTGEGYNFRWSNDAAGTGEVTYMTLDTSTTGGGDLTVKGDIIAYGAPSDERYKENIKPIESALDKVEKLQGVTFDWKESDSILDIKEDIGFIAQDVQKVVPELVRENEDGKLSLRYQGITPILLEAIKELKAEIEELKKQIK